MLLFLDTEYTGLDQPDPKLISLALVAEDGKREFYAELADTWSLEDCTSFVKLRVLPLLTEPRISRVAAQRALLKWFEQAPRNVRIACDSDTDWLFLIDLLAVPRPVNLAPTYYDLRPLIDTAVYHSTVIAYHRLHSPEHHALSDARAYRAGWLAWMDANKGARSRD